MATTQCFQVLDCKNALRGVFEALVRPHRPPIKCRVLNMSNSMQSDSKPLYDIQPLKRNPRVVFEDIRSPPRLQP